MTPQEIRLTKSPIFFIDKAIEMLKDEYKDEPLIAGYNGIVCALGYAKDSAAKDKERIASLEAEVERLMVAINSIKHDATKMSESVWLNYKLKILQTVYSLNPQK